MRKKILTLFATIILGAGMFNAVAVSQPVYAEGESTVCEKKLLWLFVPWYAGLTNADCSIKSPAEVGDTDGTNGLSTFIWTIVTNILYDLFMLADFLALGYIIYSGFLYMTSEGEPGKMTKAKDSLVRAITGFIIVLVATLAIAAIKSMLGI